MRRTRQFILWVIVLTLLLVVLPWLAAVVALFLAMAWGAYAGLKLSKPDSTWHKAWHHSMRLEFPCRFCVEVHNHG